MVSELDTDDAAGKVWLLRPTRSMTWPQAKRFIALITTISAFIAGAFASLGYWLVMPFSGLEVLAVAVAFYLVLRDGERREVVRIEGEQLVIEAGRREREQRYEFHCLWVRVQLSRSRYRYHPTRLLLGAHGKAIEVGRFLTDKERETFSQSLVNALKKKR